MNCDHMVFVFGSNLEGIHGGGAAHFAHKSKGAIWGVGLGRHGMSFAFPTKYSPTKSLPLFHVQSYAGIFQMYAECRIMVEFQVTRLGCGLAGFRDEDVAPLFQGAPSNCWFDEAWAPWLGAQARYWGTY